ncbi:hypothetical protein ACFW9D_14155 [Streptomyces sp. NPDC059524]|uniref:hypothetical protein n=1 Tax=Streptomyces sp. NPDC059524 TaxID=3346856 RepID=UPI0036746B39
MSSTLRGPSAPHPAARSGRRPGCLAAPFVLAGRVFRPARPDRVTDGAIESAQIARTAIGIVATLWLVYAYPMRQSVGSFAMDKFAETLLSTGVLVVAGPLALAVFVAAARPPLRGVYLRRLSGPLRGFAALLAAVLALALPSLTNGGVALDGPLYYVFLIAGLPLVLFALPFALTACVLCVHHAFRTADVHEVLPPLLSPLLVWAMFGVQVLDDAPVAAPLPVRILFLAGPPLSVTALSWWELRRLRTHFGITLRGALNRQGPARP